MRARNGSLFLADGEVFMHILSSGFTDFTPAFTEKYLSYSYLPLPSGSRRVYFDLKSTKMNTDRFEDRVERRWGQHRNRKHGGVWIGFFLLIIGGLLLLRATNTMVFPPWFFSWPMLLIAFGIISGIKHRFRGGFWAILLLAGGLTLADRIDPTLDVRRFMWPVIFIAAGLMFILRPKRSRHCRDWNQRQVTDGSSQTVPVPSTDTVNSGYDDIAADRRDFLDITSVFGGVKKLVLTKNFKGGDIVSFMGGSEVDLTQADFNGTVKIDTTNIFGGTKLIVPPTWDVQSDVTAVFGGVDDKRQVQGVTLDPNKVLILDGTCMFGGIEIRSFA
jgi:predicted membrane protein